MTPGAAMWLRVERGWLGIFLFGKLETSATIMDVISERISLSGHPEHMEQLYRRLQETAQSP